MCNNSESAVSEVWLPNSNLSKALACWRNCARTGFQTLLQRVCCEHQDLTSKKSSVVHSLKFCCLTCQTERAVVLQVSPSTGSCAVSSLMMCFLYQIMRAHFQMLTRTWFWTQVCWMRRLTFCNRMPYAATMDIDVEDQDFENVEYLALQRCVAVFQLLMQGMDPSAFMRSAREMTGKGNAFWNSSRRPYQVAFLVKAVTLSSLLRTAASMPEVLQSAAGIMLPEVLQPAFKQMLQTCQGFTPHESTISRWKLLLDGGFMLYQRRINSQVGKVSESNATVVRYLMADASTQHGREFEHIMLASVKSEDVRELFHVACSLQDVWSLCMFLTGCLESRFCFSHGYFRQFFPSMIFQ